MSGVKGRSGPRPKLITSIKEEIERNPGRAYEMLESIYNRGRDWLSIQCPNCSHEIKMPHTGDKDCAFYYIDRIIGKPKQSIDQRTIQLDFTPDDYIKYSNLLKGDNGSNLLTMPGNSLNDSSRLNDPTSQRESQDGIKDDNKAELDMSGDMTANIDEQ